MVNSERATISYFPAIMLCSEFVTLKYYLSLQFLLGDENMQKILTFLKSKMLCNFPLCYVSLTSCPTTKRFQQ